MNVKSDMTKGIKTIQNKIENNQMKIETNIGKLENRFNQRMGKATNEINKIVVLGKNKLMTEIKNKEENINNMKYYIMEENNRNKNITKVND